MEWAQDPTRPRRAAISSFGFSGTNAHAVIEEVPSPEPQVRTEGEAPGQRDGRPTPILISGKTDTAVRGQAAKLLLHMDHAGSVSLVDLGFSSATSRAALEHRAAIVATDPQGLRVALEALARGTQTDVSTSWVAKAVAAPQQTLAFVFSGQGSQWWGMGRGLYELFPVFADVFDAVCAGLDGLLGCSLREVLFEGDGSGLAGTGLTQPALFVVEVALCGLLESWGVVPGVVAGHSVGEFAAAYVAGVVSLEDACRLVVARGRLMEDLPSGGVMVAVEASEADVLPLLIGLEDRVGIAAINSPTSIVLSGVEDTVTTVVEQLGERRSKALTVSHAFHSPLMDPMLDAFRTVAESVTFHEPKLPIVSTVTGRPITTGEMSNPEYWVQHIRQPVRYADAVQALAEQGVNVFLEVGPGGVLTGLTQTNLDQATAIPTLRPNTAEDLSLTTALAHLHVHGTPIDWPALYTGRGARLVDLPTYPFQRDRYWLDIQSGAGDLAEAGLRDAEHPLLAAVVAMAEGDGVLLTGRLSMAAHSWLAEHVVLGTTVLPGTALVELAIRAGDQIGCGRLEELTLQTPLVLPETGSLRLQVAVGLPDEHGHRPIRLYSQQEDALATERWACHAVGAVSHTHGSSDPALQEPVVDLAEWPPAGAEPVDVSALYDQLAGAGLEYGPVFRGVHAGWRRNGEFFAETSLPEQTSVAGYGIHPALFDSALHSVGFVGSEERTDGPLVPFAWSGVRLYATGATSLRLRIAPASTGGRGALSLVAADGEGTAVFSVESLDLRPVDAEQLSRTGNTSGDGLFRVDWVPLPDPASPAVNDVRIPLRDSLTGLAGDFDPVPDVVAVRVPMMSGCGSQAPTATVQATLLLIQEWLLRPEFEPSRLVLVTQSAVTTGLLPTSSAGDAAGHSATPEPYSEVNVAQAAVWGLVRSAQLEHPGRFGLVDLVDLDDGEDTTELTIAIATDEPQMALRGTQVLVPRLVQVEQTLPTSNRQLSSTGGTVLITGASGTLGRIVARHLVAEVGVRSLVLASRSGPAAEGAAEFSAELRELGAIIDTVACDVSDREALVRLLDRVPGEYPLTGVIHAAGVTDDGVISALTSERVATVFKPKVDAAFHLHELTKDLDLTAFVLFSSAAGTFGNAGQGNYAAANAALDALATTRRTTGQPALSLAWGLWTHTSTLSAELAEADHYRMSRSGLLPLETSEGLALLDRALGVDEPVIVPARWDLPVLRDQARSGSLPVLLRSMVPVSTQRVRAAVTPSGGASTTLARELAELTESRQHDTLVKLVITHAAAVLGHGRPESVQANQAFRELGFDSLTAVELRNRLASATGVRLPAGLVFDYPTPQALAKHLRQELLGAGAAASAPIALPASDDPIAIVAMSCRYPGGVETPEDLWALIELGRDAISDFPSDRGWDLALLSEGGSSGSSDTGMGGFLYQAGEFDAGFFGISPREALAMDPQQRLLLETSWEAFEGAGIDPTTLQGSRTGVFTGAMYHDYASSLQTVPEGVEGFLGTGNSASVVSGRLSYTFGLEGPAVTVDTACSSSLV
ncbi:SDR family NAD(P)-dependent oxidoreductase, partial [Streptomyces sp. NPDC059131]|uniref:SDR family NAD(P)-dependent oxidoreductase n=1 Tax=Streptomyces sp. NPDC059131 TaxID=3346736 RepID=UPI0036B87F8C